MIKIKFKDTVATLLGRLLHPSNETCAHFIEFAFESVVVEMMGDVLQLAMLVEIDNGVVSESIDDLAVVYKLCVD